MLVTNLTASAESTLHIFSCTSEKLNINMRNQVKRPQKTSPKAALYQYPSISEGVLQRVLNIVFILQAELRIIQYVD